MVTAQLKPSESERVKILPLVLRSYVKSVSKGQIPDSDLPNQLKYAANTIEMMTCLLRDIRSNSSLTVEQRKLIDTLVSTQ